jgi:DNA-binding transcriptional LysR family regulator
MSIDRLRYFAAVVETRNLRQAAELVGISSPSMSKAISVLEAELSCKLIHPEGRGIGITPKGLEVYNVSIPLLEEYRRFHYRIKEGAKAAVKIRIATFEVFSSYFTSAFLLQNPELKALLLEMPPGKIEQAVLNGSVDLGLTYIPSPDPTLDFVEIGSFEMMIFGNKKWQSVSFEQWPFAIPTTELRIHSSDVDSMDMWPRTAPKRHIKYEFELLETALQTSRNGLSVLHCPDFVVRLHNLEIKPSLQLVSLPNPNGYRASKRVKIYAVWRKGSTIAASGIEGKFAKFMRSIQ